MFNKAKGEAGYEQTDVFLLKTLSLPLHLPSMIQNKKKYMMITLNSEWTDGLPFVKIAIFERLPSNQSDWVSCWKDPSIF